MALTSGGVLLQCRDLEWSRLPRPAAHRVVRARLLAVLPDGTYAICDREEASVELWDVDSGRATGAIDCHSRLGTVAVSPDGRWLACDGSTGAVSLISLQEPELRSALIGHRGQINAIAFSPDGATLATAGEDGTARLWNVATGTELFTLETRRGAIRTLRFSANGEWLVVGGDPRGDGTTLSVYRADPAQ